MPNSSFSHLPRQSQTYVRGCILSAVHHNEIRICITHDLDYFLFLEFSKKVTWKLYLKLTHINATFMMIYCEKFQKKIMTAC